MRNTILAVAALAVICATTAFGQGGQPGPGGQDGMRPGGMRGMPGGSCPAAALLVPRSNLIDPLTQEAKLTETQVTQLRTQLVKWEATLRTLQQTAGEATKALRQALVADTYDAAKVTELATAAQKAEAAIITASIDQWTQIRAILNAEQVKKLAQLMNPMMGRMQRPGAPLGPPPAGGIPPPPGDGAAPPPPGDGGTPPPPSN